MSEPDAATIDALELEMNAIGFLTGTVAALDDVAYKMAWQVAEDYLGTNLITGTVAAERHIFPQGWLDFDLNFRFLQLDKTYLVSVTTATVVHDLGSCDCDTDDVSACVLAYDLRQSTVEVRASSGAISAGCTCLLDLKPAWVDVTYVAGIWACLADIPATVKVALAILAKEFQALGASGGATVSASFVTEWQSMDYQERLNLTTTVLGSSPQANMAARLLRGYRVTRMVGFRGRPAVD